MTVKLCVTVFMCLHGVEPMYLSDVLVAGRRYLRSADMWTTCSSLETNDCWQSLVCRELSLNILSFEHLSNGTIVN